MLRTIHADCRDGLKQIPDATVQTCVTSPPYWGLRAYLRKDHPDKAREIGQEKTPLEYVETIVAVCREIHRGLRQDGTLWLNLGDSYAGGGNGGGGSFANDGPRMKRLIGTDKNIPGRKGSRGIVGGLKRKDLIGIPWRCALALQDDGWYLRSDIIWAKPNPMPESVTDRPTRSHEYIFLLTKSPRYYYDHEAIKVPCTESTVDRLSQDVAAQAGSTRANGGAKTNGNMKAVGKIDKQRGHSRRHQGFNDRWNEMERDEQCTGLRNKRDVWTVAPANYKEAHFATFPPELIRPCILAGSKPGDTVLDPFGGSGTTAAEALALGRKAITIELNDEYLPMIHKRTSNMTPGLPL